MREPSIMEIAANKVANRRSFLGTAVCVPAVAAAVTAGLTRRAEPVPIPAALPAARPDGVGYHETEHVRKFYRSAGYF